MTPEQEHEIARLRSLNLSPKQIARKLGLRPSEVSASIQFLAQSLNSLGGSGVALAPLHHCLINESAALSLLDHLQEKDNNGSTGLSQIFVTRVERGNLLVCSYLVDYWCLGVKSTFGPRKMDLRKYESTIQKTSQQFNEEFREISLVQAQSIIFGSVDYAQKLGLETDPDFERSKVLLGKRPEQLIEIEFGKDGKPFYINGPYDNADKIIFALEKSVGKDNFHFMMQVNPSNLHL